jgi:4-aminobutyrate aminotransferase-like enzyme
MKLLYQISFANDDISFALRTPELFSFRYFTNPETGAELSPDVLVLSKGIAAGYPLSMVLGKKGFLNIPMTKSTCYKSTRQLGLLPLGM